MTEKRFIGSSGGVYDQYKSDRFTWSEWEEILQIMNNLNEKARERSKALSKLQKENEQLKQTNQELYDKLQETMSYKSLKMGEVSILERENEQLESENEKQAKALKNMCDVEICQICEHNELLFEQTPYGDEYDTRCKKGFRDYKGKFYGIEVQECDDWELCKGLYE